MEHCNRAIRLSLFIATPAARNLNFLPFWCTAGLLGVPLWRHALVPIRQQPWQAGGQAGGKLKRQLHLTWRQSQTGASKQATWWSDFLISARRDVQYVGARAGRVWVSKNEGETITVLASSSAAGHALGSVRPGARNRTGQFRHSVAVSVVSHQIKSPRKRHLQ